jgi:hypothetical protein
MMKQFKKEAREAFLISRAHKQSNIRKFAESAFDAWEHEQIAKGGYEPIGVRAWPRVQYLESVLEKNNIMERKDELEAGIAAQVQLLHQGLSAIQDIYPKQWRKHATDQQFNIQEIVDKKKELKANADLMAVLSRFWSKFRSSQIPLRAQTIYNGKVFRAWKVVLSFHEKGTIQSVDEETKFLVQLKQYGAQLIDLVAEKENQATVDALVAESPVEVSPQTKLERTKAAVAFAISMGESRVEQAKVRSSVAAAGVRRAFGNTQEIVYTENRCGVKFRWHRNS